MSTSRCFICWADDNLITFYPCSCEGDPTIFHKECLEKYYRENVLPQTKKDDNGSDLLFPKCTRCKGLVYKHTSGCLPLSESIIFLENIGYGYTDTFIRTMMYACNLAVFMTLLLYGFDKISNIFENRAFLVVHYLMVLIEVILKHTNLAYCNIWRTQVMPLFFALFCLEYSRRLAEIFEPDYYMTCSRPLFILADILFSDLETLVTILVYELFILRTYFRVSESIYTRLFECAIGVFKHLASCYQHCKIVIRHRLTIGSKERGVKLNVTMIKMGNMILIKDVTAK